MVVSIVVFRRLAQNNNETFVKHFFHILHGAMTSSLCRHFYIHMISSSSFQHIHDD